MCVCVRVCVCVCVSEARAGIEGDIDFANTLKCSKQMKEEEKINKKRM